MNTTAHEAQPFTCPRCKGAIPNALNRGQYPGALSRADNKTEVCSDCGTDEALFNFRYPGVELPPLDQPVFPEEDWTMTSAQLRVVSTDDLRHLARTAERRGLNRVPDLSRLDVDPDGTHLLELVLFGHNMDRAHIPLHHRCRLLVKITGSMTPVEAMIDVLDSDWKRLHTVAETTDTTTAPAEA